MIQRSQNNSRSKIASHFQNTFDSANLGVIREEHKRGKNQSHSVSKNQSSKKSKDRRTDNNPTISKDGFLSANDGKSASRPSAYSMSDDPENKEMVN